MDAKRKAWLLGSDVALLVIGIVCLVFNSPMTTGMIVIAGVGYLLCGIGDLVGVDSFKGFDLFSGWTFFDCVFLILLAFLCFVSGILPQSIFWLGSMALMFLAGAAQFLAAIHLTRANKYASTQWGFFAAAVLLMVFGAALFIRPEMFLIFSGISLVFRALVAILINLTAKRKTKAKAAH